MRKRLKKILKNYFGYDEFRSGQIEIIESIASGKNTLAILPTGGGKSLCFQIPGLFFSGTTIVISPLISLMKDQVDTLNKKNIPSTYINGSLTKNEIKERLDNLTHNKYKFVYVAPERLIGQSFIKACLNTEISHVAIDESHCASMWGHDFRPSFQKIPNFIKLLKSRPVVSAFTATATPRVKQDIVQILELGEHQEFINSFQRDNLTLYNINCDSYFDKEINLLRILKKHHHQAGIIYASTRKTAVDLANQLNYLLDEDNENKIYFYHGGMTNEERGKIQELYLENKIRIIVATNAFGMGVDKSNIRFVIHYQLPGNLENFYQEAGRAGRDRLLSHCYLLFYPPDIKIQLDLIKNNLENKKQTSIKINNFKKMILYTQKKSCLQEFILNYFGEKGIRNCEKMCGNCLHFSKKNLIDESEIEKIKKLFIFCKNIYQNNSKANKVDMSIKIIQYIYLLKPKNKDHYLKIPGVGRGWVDFWHDTIQSYLIKEESTHYDN